MKLRSKRGTRILGITLIDTVVGMGIATAILAAFTTGAVTLQRSFCAIEDYAKGQNDQMRISDYLSLDLRRAFTITILKDVQTGYLTVTMTLPNFYASANTPYDPTLKAVTGWAYKKHEHNKHANIILNQSVEYGPTGTTTQQVVYTYDNTVFKLYRCVNGAVAPSDPNAPDPAGVTTVARDVSDFNVTVNDLDETATTQITFKPRFRTLGLNAGADTAAALATTYFQTTLTRNTR